MTQSDSQDSESEVPDPSDFENPTASEDGGGVGAPESIGGPGLEETGSEIDSFGDEVEEMLSSIEIDDAVDEASLDGPAEEEEDDASLVEEIRNQIANAFSEDLEETLEEEIETMPDPRALMREAAGESPEGDATEIEAAMLEPLDENALSEIQASVADAFEENGLDEASGVEQQPLAEVDDDDDEILSMPDPQSLMSEASGEAGSAAVPETSDPSGAAEQEEEEEEFFAPLPSPDELLAEAGKLLNGEREASSEVDDDEILSMPDPQSLMSEASREAGPLDAPEKEQGDKRSQSDDPVSVVSESEPTPTPVVGNIADRAGDLPPPPPAPVALDESELTEEEEPVEEVEEILPAPFSSAIDFAASVDSTEGEKEEVDELASLVPENVELTDPAFDAVAEETISSDFEEKETIGEAYGEAAPELVAAQPEPAVAAPVSRPVNRLWYSIPLAASIMFVGIGLILMGLKDELYEFLGSGKMEGSSLTREIAAVSQRVIEDLGPENHYEMRWMESDVNKISDTEIRIHARVGAELTADLYKRVDEAQALAELAFHEDDLVQAKSWMAERMPEVDLPLPERPWSALCQLLASKGDVFSVSVTYRLVRSSPEEDWELANIRVNGEESRSVWGGGSPIEAFGRRALDTQSARFSSALRSYEEDGLAFLADVNAFQSELAAKKERTLQELQKRREQLALALSEGAYFTGVAIVGEDGDESREVSLVITESRNEGDIIQGIFRLGSGDAPEKHFMGIVDFEEKEGSLQGLLSLTTVAFSGQPDSQSLPLFFRPGTVSRILLRTDGSQMEGDASSVSLRLARSL